MAASQTLSKKDIQPAKRKPENIPKVAEKKTGLSLKGSEGKTFSHPKPPSKSKKESSNQPQAVISITEGPSISGTNKSQIN